MEEKKRKEDSVEINVSRKKERRMIRSREETFQEERKKCLFVRRNDSWKNNNK